MTQNDVKMTLKWRQNDAKMTPKWRQNDMYGQGFQWRPLIKITQEHFDSWIDSQHVIGRNSSIWAGRCRNPTTSLAINPWPQRTWSRPPSPAATNSSWNSKSVLQSFWGKKLQPWMCYSGWQRPLILTGGSSSRKMATSASTSTTKRIRSTSISFLTSGLTLICASRRAKSSARSSTRVSRTQGGAGVARDSSQFLLPPLDVVIFDNSFSYLRAKTLWYRFSIAYPSAKEIEEAYPELRGLWLSFSFFLSSSSFLNSLFHQQFLSDPWVCVCVCVCVCVYQGIMQEYPKQNPTVSKRNTKQWMTCKTPSLGHTVINRSLNDAQMTYKW